MKCAPDGKFVRFGLFVFKNNIRMQNIHLHVSEKIICVHPRNLRENNTMNNPCVKKYFLFFICHSVILPCNALTTNKITY